MSSFIETTLPPGYSVDYTGLDATRHSFGRDRLHGWWWSTFTADGEHASVGYDTKAECYRAAWQHWTATVLRGHRLHWMRTEDGRLIASANDPSILHDPSILWRPLSGLFIVGVEYKDEALGWDILTLAASRDVDEAMARFAALVLAAEGMVPR